MYFWLFFSAENGFDDIAETLPAWTQLFICKPCQKEKLLIYFDIKRAIAACQSR